MTPFAASACYEITKKKQNKQKNTTFLKYFGFSILKIFSFDELFCTVTLAIVNVQ